MAKDWIAEVCPLLNFSRLLAVSSKELSSLTFAINFSASLNAVAAPNIDAPKTSNPPTTGFSPRASAPAPANPPPESAPPAAA